MTECQECRFAAAQPHHAFRSGCHGCRCRAFSRSPFFFERRRSGEQSDSYRRMLNAGGVTDEEVLAAYLADKVRYGDSASRPVTGATSVFSDAGLVQSHASADEGADGRLGTLLP